MNEDEEKPILKDSDTKKHNKTVVIETRQEIKKVHSHKHSDSSKKKSEEKHHHHHESNDNEEIHHQRQQENVQLHSEVKEKRNNSNHVHFHHQKNEMNYSKEKEELRKWRAFGDHIIDMLLLSIPKSEIPSIPQVGKMAAIETLCSTACRILQNPSQNPKYQELEAKYNKCKNQMRRKFPTLEKLVTNVLNFILKCRETNKCYTIICNQFIKKKKMQLRKNYIN